LSLTLFFKNKEILDHQIQEMSVTIRRRKPSRLDRCCPECRYSILKKRWYKKLRQQIEFVFVSSELEWNRLHLDPILDEIEQHKIHYCQDLDKLLSLREEIIQKVKEHNGHQNEKRIERFQQFILTWIESNGPPTPPPTVAKEDLDQLYESAVERKKRYTDFILKWIQSNWPPLPPIVDYEF
jgi:hypothetical protein